MTSQQSEQHHNSLPLLEQPILLYTSAPTLPSTSHMLSDCAHKLPGNCIIPQVDDLDAQVQNLLQHMVKLPPGHASLSHF